MTTSSNAVKTNIKVIESCQSSYINLQNLIYQNVKCDDKDDLVIAQTINCLRAIVQSYFDDNEIREAFEKKLLKQHEKASQAAKCYIHANNLHETTIQTVDGIKLLVLQDSDKIRYEIM